MKQAASAFSDRILIGFKQVSGLEYRWSLFVSLITRLLSEGEQGTAGVDPCLRGARGHLTVVYLIWSLIRAG